MLDMSHRELLNGWRSACCAERAGEISMVGLCHVHRRNRLDRPLTSIEPRSESFLNLGALERCTTDRSGSKDRRHDSVARGFAAPVLIVAVITPDARTGRPPGGTKRWLRDLPRSPANLGEEGTPRRRVCGDP